MRAAVLWLVAAGCASAGSGDPQLIDAPGGDPIDAEVPDAGPTVITLSNNTDATTITAGNSVGCVLDHDGNTATSPITAENSYYRTFNLSQFTNRSFTAQRVDLGVEQADSVDGAQDVRIRLHALVGQLSTNNITVLHDQLVTISDVPTGTVVPVLLSSPVFVPASTQLAVEVLVPDSTSTGNNLLDVFFIGSNAAGESSPSYIRAPSGNCAMPQPTTLSSIGFPNMHIVLTVTGTTP
jgi:hypothetical protein